MAWGAQPNRLYGLDNETSPAEFIQYEVTTTNIIAVASRQNTLTPFNGQIEFINGKLYFTAYEPVYGRELYAYDGMNAPARLTDVAPSFLNGLPLVFQRGKAKGLEATYHFTFTGAEKVQATIIIRNQTLQVSEGHSGKADLHVTADSSTWLGFLAKERNLVWALLRRKIRLKGSPRLLLAFGKCFPS